MPHPPTYALGTSAEAGEFAARHHIGLGVSYGTFELMAKATGYYRERCARLRLAAGTGRHHLPRQHDPRRNRRCGRGSAGPARQTGGVPGPAVVARRAAGRPTQRNIAGETSRQPVGAVLPISFCGGPDRVVEQLRRCREQIGAGVVDLSLQDPGTGDTSAMMSALDLFGRKVLPRIREI